MWSKLVSIACELRPNFAPLPVWNKKTRTDKRHTARILIAKGQSKAPCCCTALRVFDTEAAGGVILLRWWKGLQCEHIFWLYEWSALNNNPGTPPPPVAAPPSGRNETPKWLILGFKAVELIGLFLGAQGFVVDNISFFCRFQSESCRVDVKLLRAKSAASCACMLISNFVIKYAAADCTLVERLLAYNDDDYWLRRHETHIMYCARRTQSCKNASFWRCQQPFQRRQGLLVIS